MSDKARNVTTVSGKAVPLETESESVRVLLCNFFFCERQEAVSCEGPGTGAMSTG